MLASARRGLKVIKRASRLPTHSAEIAGSEKRALRGRGRKKRPEDRGKKKKKHVHGCTRNMNPNVCTKVLYAGGERAARGR